MFPRKSFKTINNEVEFEALVTGIRLAKDVDITSIRVGISSQTREKEYLTKRKYMKNDAKMLTETFKNFHMENPPRKANN